MDRSNENNGVTELSDENLDKVSGGSSSWVYSTAQSQQTTAGGTQSGYHVYYTTGVGSSGRW